MLLASSSSSYLCMKSSFSFFLSLQACVLPYDDFVAAYLYY